MGRRNVRVDQQRDAPLDRGVQHGHLLHEGEQFVAEQAVKGTGRVQQNGQAGTEPAGYFELAVELDEVGRHRGAQAPGGIVERPADLGQRQAQATQKADPVQPRDVSVVVEPVPGMAAARGDQQADLLVVVQGANGQPRRGRQLTHPACVSTPLPGHHATDRTTSRGVRCKTVATHGLLRAAQTNVPRRPGHRRAYFQT